MAWCVVQFPRRLGLKRKEIVFSYFRVYSLPPPAGATTGGAHKNQHNFQCAAVVRDPTIGTLRRKRSTSARRWRRRASGICAHGARNFDHAPRGLQISR